MDPTSRLMLFLRALLHPTEQGEVNAELTRRQDAVDVRLGKLDLRIDRLAETARRQDAALRHR